MAEKSMKIKDFIEAMNLRLPAGSRYKLKIEFDSGSAFNDGWGDCTTKIVWGLIFTPDSRDYSRFVVYDNASSGESLLERVTEGERLRNITALEADVE